MGLIATPFQEESKSLLMNITAESAMSLLSQLSKLDVSVPPRTKGRTKEHTERYTATHLLAAIATTDLLVYPLNFKHRDRPDFSLSMNAETLGVEHTEAVPENHAHRTALREKGHGPNTYFEPRSRIGERKKTQKELITEIDCNRPGPPWVGDSAEREWAEAMRHFAMRKRETALSPGFDRFPRQWLLIYDNWPVPAVDVDIASQYLQGLLSEGNLFQIFEKIFVIRGRFCSEIHSAGSSCHPINNFQQTTPLCLEIRPKAVNLRRGRSSPPRSSRYNDTPEKKSLKP